MTNWQTLKDSIKAKIKKNGNQEITGEVLQSVLVSIISTMGEQNALCRGVATPTTNPGTIDGPLYYFATQAGTYANFDGLVLPQGLSILFWDSSKWTATTAFVVEQDVNGDSTNAVSQKAVRDALTNLQGVLDSVESIVDSHTDDIAALNTSVSETSRAVENNTSNITQLQSKVTTNTNNITKLQSDVATDKSNITQLQNKVTTNTNNIADNAEQLTILADLFEPIPGQIDILEQNQINDRLVTDKVAKDLQALTQVVNNIEAVNTIKLGTSGTLDVRNLAPGIYKVYNSSGNNLVGTIVATGSTPKATSILAIGNFAYKTTAAFEPYIEWNTDTPDTIFTYHYNDVWYSISLKELNNKKAEADVPPRIEVVWNVDVDTNHNPVGELIVKNAKWYLDKGYIPILFRWVKKVNRYRADGQNTSGRTTRNGLMPYGFQNLCEVKRGTYRGTTDYFLHLNSKGFSEDSPTRNPTYTEDILPLLAKNCIVGQTTSSLNEKRYAWGRKRLSLQTYIVNKDTGDIKQVAKWMRFSFYLGFVPKPSKFAARITAADCVSNLAKFKIQLQWGGDNTLQLISPTY